MPGANWNPWSQVTSVVSLDLFKQIGQGLTAIFWLSAIYTNVGMIKIPGGDFKNIGEGYKAFWKPETT